MASVEPSWLGGGGGAVAAARRKRRSGDDGGGRGRAADSAGVAMDSPPVSGRGDAPGREDGAEVTTGLEWVRT